MDRDPSEIAKLTERIAKDPKSKLFVPLAEEYKKIGDIETSIQVLTEGLKNNPGYVTARSFLGRLLMEKGDLTGAQKEFEEVIKAIPDNLLAQRKLGDLYALQGRPRDALARYRAAQGLSPKDQEIIALIADLEAGRDITGKLAKAAPQQAPGQALKQDEQKGSAEAAQRPAASPSKPATARPPKAGAPPVQEKEAAEEVLVVEPLEHEPGAGTEPPAAAGGFDFLAEGKLEGGEGNIPGLEVAAPGGFFEEPPLHEPLPEHDLEPAVPLLVPETDEEIGAAGQPPGTEVFAARPGEKAGRAESLKKSDDFTTDTLAELYISQGFYEKAIDIYERMLAENPGHRGLKDKLTRLRDLASGSGEPVAEAGQPEGGAFPAFESPGAPSEREGTPEFLETGREEFVPPAMFEAGTASPPEPVFGLVEPGGKAVFPGPEPEAREYVPPAPGPEEHEHPAPFGGFDLSEREPAPSAARGDEQEMIAEFIPPKAEDFAQPSSARPEPKAVEYAGQQPERGRASAETVKAGRKETISRLEHWLKNISKEK